MTVGQAHHTRNQNRPRRIITLLGPAFVASIAYVDPGNVAANLSAGAQFGYLLVWVLVAANLMAVLVQYLSARLGIVAERSLPQLVGDRLERRGPRLAYWAQAEIVAAATDLAEVIGGAIALNILFDLPLLLGGVIVGAVSMGLLTLQAHGKQQRFEYLVIALLVVITVGFVAGSVVSPIAWDQVGRGLLPGFAGERSVLLAASMLGATVMPHAIYLHSALVTDRHGTGHDRASKKRLIKASRLDVVLGLFVAGSVNVAMLLMAAAALPGIPGTDTIDGAAAAITEHLGQGIGIVFAVGLLASGLASTSVGSYAGATIMAGLLRVRVPILVRRVVTLIPALVILACGVEPTWALVLSQVLLSVGIPFALVPLVHFTSSRAVMGEFASPRWLGLLAWAVVAVIVVLNVALVWLAFP